MYVNPTTVPPAPERVPPRTTIDPGYRSAPAELLDPTSTSGRLQWFLRTAAALRDGNAILRMVATNVYANSLPPPPPHRGGPLPRFDQTALTAITQLAATGANAYAAWTAAPTGAPDLATYLIGLGMAPSAALTSANQIMSDFTIAMNAVRSPSVGMDPSLRQGLPAEGWIAVCGEMDPPDFPVNVSIAKYPQFHVALTIDGVPLSVRYIMASSQGIAIPQGASANPSAAIPTIPDGDEVILYIHGEGSRAEEATDFIDALLASAGNRSFTVIAFDQPGCGYTTSVINGVHETVPHLAVNPMPPLTTVSVDGYGVATSPFGGSPLLDFVEHMIEEFITTVVHQQGKVVRAVVGGSMGGHMGLRLNARGGWAEHVIAWSPACVWDYSFQLNLATGTVNVPNRTVSDPMAAYRAAASEDPGTRDDFFQTVFYKNTADVTVAGVGLLAAGLVASDLLAAVGAIPILGGIIGGIATVDVAAAILSLPTIPPQPQMWYRDDWGPAGGGPAVPCVPPPNSGNFGQAKLVYICEGQLDRQEIYNTNMRQWHWRIAGECVGFTFDSLAPFMRTPMLLMVGDSDNYPLVEFRKNVMALGGSVTCPGTTQTIQDTGHSIHNERPYFLAQQLMEFIPAPPDTFVIDPTIKPLKDDCGIGAGVGGVQQFVTGGWGIDRVTYSWSASGSGAQALPPTTHWDFSVQLGDVYGPVEVSVIITYRGKQYGSSLTYYPETEESIFIKRLLCHMLKWMKINTFANPLWDPGRDYSIEPLTITELQNLQQAGMQLATLAGEALAAQQVDGGQRYRA